MMLFIHTLRSLEAGSGLPAPIPNLLLCGYNTFTDYAWDPAKAAGNVQKHNVSFVEAQSVFDDPLATVFEDEEHSETEVREFIVGHSDQNRLLLVCFTERQDYEDKQ